MRFIDRFADCRIHSNGRRRNQGVRRLPLPLPLPTRGHYPRHRGSSRRVPGGRVRAGHGGARGGSMVRAEAHSPPPAPLRLWLARGAGSLRRVDLVLHPHAPLLGALRGRVARVAPERRVRGRGRPLCAHPRASLFTPRGAHPEQQPQRQPHGVGRRAAAGLALPSDHGAAPQLLRGAAGASSADAAAKNELRNRTRVR